jgi:hypothetical protein
VLEVFKKTAELDLDLEELAQQAKSVEEQLVNLLARVEQAIEQQQESKQGEPSDEGEEPSFSAELAETEAEEKRLAPRDQANIEHLFDQAREDRSKAYELKRELDRLEVFKDYEDRFLDLFRPRT